MSSRCTRAIVAFSIALAALGTGACAGTTEATLVYDYPAVYVDSVPSHALYQPRAYYHGRYAYLVDGRWYYPTHRGWVVFREEPRELQRYRLRYHDIHRYPGYRYDRYDPPAYRYRAPEYGTPALPPSAPRYREPTPAMPPPTYYRTPSSPPSSPRYPATPAPAPRSYYRAPSSPQPAPPRATPPPAPAPRAAPPPAAPPPRMPALRAAPPAR